MGVEIRLPNITGATEKEQLLQLKSYLYQLSEQLQWAFDNINTSGGSGNGSYVVNQIPIIPIGSSGGNAQATFSEIKSLIIKSAEIVDAYYEEINKRLEGIYVAQSDFGAYAEKTALEIEATSKSITQNYENVQIIIQNTKSELVGEIIGTQEALNETINSVASNAEAYTDAAKAEATAYTDEAKGELDSKVDAANGRIDETNGNVANLGEGLSAANGRIDGVDQDLQSSKSTINDSIQTVANSVSTVDRLLANAKAQLQGGIDDLEFSLEGLRQIVVGVTAYVKSGLLYYTDAGVPVYGIEIGQQVEANGTEVFNKFARFTSEKLSFYDANGNEVAYISDKKLYIGQAEITISLKVGGLNDLVMANGDVVTKWEGVSG